MRKRQGGPIMNQGNMTLQQVGWFASDPKGLFMPGISNYAAMGNNPIMYVDPNGEEPVTVAIIVGAVIGAYMGGTIANNDYNPGNWNFNSGQTWASENAPDLPTSTFTIPAGVTQIKLGLLWSGGVNGNTFYINRVMLYKTDWEYQYFMRDHLGSPRVVLQTIPNTYTFTATMEAESFSQPQPDGSNTGESAQFLNMSANREIAFSGANATVGGTRAYQLNSSYQTGPARSFKVFPGDVINASTWAYYPSGGSYTKNTLATMGSLIAGVLGGGDPTAIDGIMTKAYGGSQGTNPQLWLSPDQGSGRPSAFINYILFDETYTPLEAKSQPVGATANLLHQISLPAINVTQTGYLFVYLSYDNQTGGADVYFDEFKITYQESPVIQINSYYPFGMTAFSWVREGESQNKFLYQGKEYETLTGLHDFHARQFDAALGRWFVGDPAGQFASPYLGMGNNPMMMTDPDGRWAGWDDVVVAAVGFVYGYLEHGFSHNDWGWNAVGNGALYAAMFELGYLSGGTSAGLTGQAAMNAAGGYLGSSAVNIAASQIAPAVPIYQSDNLNLSVSPTFSLDGIGASLNASYTSGDFTYGAGAGITGRFGGGYRAGYGGGVSYFNGSWGGGYSLFSYGGHNPQRLGEFSGTWGGGDWGFRISNDFFPLADGGDRFRTGAGQLSYKDYSIGFLIHTGDPGLTDREMESSSSKAGVQYSSSSAKDPSLRSGIAYFGYQNYRVGWNSDGIRHTVQNRAMHDNVIKWISGEYSPWFQPYRRPTVPSLPYFNTNANNPFSLWGY